MGNEHKGAFYELIKEQKKLQEMIKPIQSLIDQQRELTEMFKAPASVMEDYKDIISPSNFDYIANGAVQEMVTNNFAKYVSDIIEPVLGTVKKLSIIEFPDIPDFETPYDNLEKLAKNNSKYGWTLTGEMDVHFYLNEELLDKDQIYIDEKFTDYFEANSRREFYKTTENIRQSIDDKWKEVIEDSIELYETDKFRIIIPLLITIIEGEIAKIADSDKFGRTLLKEWQGQIESEEERFIVIVSYTLNHFLLSNVFGYKKFGDERGEGLNRNWVLHGRDDPSLWTRTDALKLFNIISSLQFIQD